jgi:peptidoglycan/LPS O-acetylase OafA/YrhL
MSVPRVMGGGTVRAHYQVLDGLRGTAAISVVIFHIFELITPNWGHNPFPHGYLAVDFFYALSGFVIGYAYDGRRAVDAPERVRLGLWGFFKRRLIRLHPMVPVAVTIGLICYLNDPNVAATQRIGVGIPFATIALAYGLNLFLLPTPILPNHWDETHPLDAPTWTLFWEYIANVVYALWLCRIGRKLHVALLLMGAAWLVYAAVAMSAKPGLGAGLGWGWGYESLWVAGARLTYPFLAGLLVYRLGWKIRLPAPYLTASLIVLAVLAAPGLSGVSNSLLEAGMIILVFPVALMVGASITEVKGWTGPLCRFAGELSYPLYIVHYPFVFLYGHWAWAHSPGALAKYSVAAGVFVWVIVLATGLLYGYDKPVRAWLGRKFVKG